MAELLRAATTVFSEKGYEAATMTEIAARANAPIGSLYQFFPEKEALADTLVQNYVGLLAADLKALEVRASRVNTRTLVEGLFGLLRAHSRERAAALPLVEARMDAPTRRTTFRLMFRGHVAAILLAHVAGLPEKAARDMAVVVVQLMKTASALGDEEHFPGRKTGLRELQALAVQYVQQRGRARAD
ncbi:MAG TPA: helix-turn-helix domain-containing protein [Steroidobacteraceae bacterium]|nr:helix-turn-helix domain-containing protein [Steroidobacteraceae bacterium]